MTTAKAAKTAVTKTAPYDVADYLRTPEEQAAYINAWLTDAPDDVAGIARAIGDVARAQGMSRVARDAGLKSRTSLYKALGENGNPTFGTALAVLRALHLHLVVSIPKPTRAQPRAMQAAAARPRKRHEAAA
jgi:probable addiction module antidote protein